MTTKSTKPTVAELQAVVARQNEQIAQLMQMVQAQQSAKAPGEVAVAASETTTAAKEMIGGMFKLACVVGRVGRKAVGTGLVSVGSRLV